MTKKLHPGATLVAGLLGLTSCAQSMAPGSNNFASSGGQPYSAPAPGQPYVNESLIRIDAANRANGPVQVQVASVKMCLDSGPVESSALGQQSPSARFTKLIIGCADESNNQIASSICNRPNPDGSVTCFQRVRGYNDVNITYTTDYISQALANPSYNVPNLAQPGY